MWIESGIAQPLDGIAIASYVCPAFYVLITGQAFDEYDRGKARLPVKLKEDKVAVLGRMSTNFERNHLNRYPAAVRSVNDLAELPGHGINAANATTQHGLVEQYAVSWPVVLLK